METSDDLTSIITATLRETAPGLVDSIIELKRMGVSKERIIARCKEAGARGLVLACVTLVVEEQR